VSGGDDPLIRVTFAALMATRASSTSTNTPRAFDPGAAAGADSGIYGLPHTEAEARVIVLPVPFAATTSYGGGAEKGPKAVFDASKQVDLFDIDTGRPYEAGIHMRKIPQSILRLHREGRGLAKRVIDAGGEIGGSKALARALARVNEISIEVDDWVYEQSREIVQSGKLLALVGGDHSTPFGAIRAVAERHPGVGVLHVDAHADLRHAYEGLDGSHASIMYNVTSKVPDVAKLVQVGIRDFSEEEFDRIEQSSGRIRAHFDSDLQRATASGESWIAQCQRIVSELPDRVYVSFDIDGLDPTLCPHTGTPVPGGLGFAQANQLIGEVARSGRTIVGVDLNEVVPGDDEWDGNVGARLLYKMIGWMLVSNGASTPPRRGAR
jgi:agmatinase